MQYKVGYRLSSQPLASDTSYHLVRTITLPYACRGKLRSKFPAVVGYLADRIQSRRVPMLFGLLALTASTAIYCVSTSPRMLLIARASQGASAVVIWVVGMALLIDTMGAADSGAAIGWTSVAFSAGSTLGPFAGGAIYDVGGHYAVFGLAFAILAIDLALRFTIVERKDAERLLARVNATSYGAIGDGPLQGEVAPCANKPDSSSTHAPSDSTDADLTKASPAPLADSPSNPSHMPPVLRLLLNPRILTALWAVLSTSLMICALEAILPLYTQRLFTWSPTLSGANFAVFLLPVLLDPFFGRLAASRTLRAIFATTGFILGSLAFFILTAVTAPTTVRKAILWAMLIVLGLGICLASTPPMLDMGDVVEAEEERSPGIYGPGKGVATSYALYNAASAIGSLTGPALAGGLMERIGWVGVCVGLGSLYAFSAVLMALFCGGWIGEKWSGAGLHDRESEDSSGDIDR